MRALDVAVIGGGVAGLTAALFAARLGRSTIVLVSPICGGQLATINRIEDFPGFPDGVAGYDLGPSIQEQAIAAGAEVEMSEVLALQPAGQGWLLQCAGGPIEARAVIVATGSVHRKLNVPGEDRLAGKGVSHCASCDGPLLRGKAVIVVGAGDSGMQEALVLAEHARSVVVLEQGVASTAQSAYRDRVAANARITLRTHCVLDEVLGEAAVAGARIRDVQDGRSETLEADAVFVYTGLAPNTALIAELVALDAMGRVPTDASMHTCRPGLFAAGDIRIDAVGQAITAAGDGATAAFAAHRYLG